MVSKRHKRYVPTDFDLTEYDSHLFKKQMDFEIMKIEVVKTNSTETSTGIERYVTRQKNIEGQFRRLMDELTTIAKQYSREFDDIM